MKEIKNENNKNNNLKEINGQRTAHFFKFVKVLFVLAFYFFIVYLLWTSIKNIFFPQLTGGYELYFNLFITFVIGTWLVQFISSVMAIYAIIVIYKRTRYSGYIFEGMGFMLFTLDIIFLALSAIYYLWFFFYLVFEIIFTIQYSYLRKPLIWQDQYQRKYINVYSTKSDIIFRQSLYIDDYQDGFSQRPFFVDFSELGKEVTNIEETSLSFAKFLALNGDLIDYEYHENKLSLYLRTSYLQRGDFFNPLGFYKKIKKILHKKNLTCLVIDFNTHEMNFKLSKDDYKGLNEVTFNQLVSRVLNQFRIALKNYNDGKFLESYEDVFPDVIKTRSLIIDDYLIVYLVIGYIIGCLTVGIAYIYFGNILSFRVFPDNLLFIFGWPIISLFGLEYVFGIIIGNPDSNNYLHYIPVIFLVHLIAFAISIVFLDILIKKRIKIKKDPLKGLKLPNNENLNLN